MLNTIHSIAKGFGAKVLLALLVLSFAVWGIGDMVRSPNRNKTVATVGDMTITQDAFKRLLSREIEKLRSAVGESYSPSLLKTMQVPQQVLQTLISQSLTEQEIRELNFKPDDAYVARLIRNNPAFHDEKGNFSKEIFRSRLTSAGISENTYIERLRRQTSASLIVDSLDTRVPIADAAVRTLYLGRQQQRSFTLYIMDHSLVGNVGQPDNAQIEAYYNEHGEQFSAPELRSLSYVTFTSADAKDGNTVSEDELQAAYHERIDEFRHEERRKVEQLLYSTEEKAKEAFAMAREGKNFAQVAQDTKAINKDSLSLGLVDRKNLLDAAAEKVFTAEKGGVIEPVQSPFGWHIFRVVSIEPASTSPLKAVRAELEKDLKRQKTDEAANRLANTLEDALAGGSSLQEAAGAQGLKVHKLGPITAQGKSPEGNEVKIPDLDKFMEVAFKTDEKTESSVTFSKGGTYYIVGVDTVAPEHIRPLASVKDQAILLWQKSEREKRLLELVPEIAPKLSDANERDKVLARYAIGQVATDPAKRTDQTIAGYALPAQMVADMFVRKPGESTSYYQLKDGSYVMAVVDRIILASLPKDDAERKKALADTRKKLEQSARNELVDQYMAYLARKHPVSVEPGAIEAATNDQ